MSYQYPLVRPFLKPKNFCPNPIVKYGIPSYADSIVNKKVIGTPAWREFWQEQVYYCINGYTTNGVFIPGRYYHYLNFCKTSSVKGGGSFYPDYVDSQYEYFLLVEEAKRLGKNIINPKGRRKGVSVMSDAIVDHGYRFLQNYHAGVAAGKKEYSEDFLDKWIYIDSLMVPEFKVKKLSNNYDDIIAGWEEKDEMGDWNKKGTQNIIYVRTMFSDPEVFKGKYLNDVVFEESGEFDNLIKTWQATEACVKDGDIQYGTMYIYGTGGNIKTGSKGFQDIWHHYEDYNCLRYFMSGPKYFRPCVAGSKDDKGIINEDIPNLLQYADYQRIGMEDEERALERITEKKKQLLKSKDMTKYWEYCKDNPTDIKDVFRRAASNNFPIEVINDQIYTILSEDKRYSKYKLEYKTDDKGNVLIPRQVVANPAKEDDDENECVLILNSGLPMPGYRNLHVGGIDSYDQDQSLTSSSLGAMVILRRRHTIAGVDDMLPVLLIRCRPKRKEKFYEMCMMSSILYDLRDNTLVDVRCPLIIQHYKNSGCEYLLAKRPKKFESENSDQRHDYGVSLNQYSKPLMIALLQTYFLDHGHKIWFQKILDEALNYDVLEKESDNDTIDALGIALMLDSDKNYGFVDENDKSTEDAYDYPEYSTDENGYIQAHTVRIKNKDLKKVDMDIEILKARNMSFNYDSEENNDFD